MAASAGRRDVFPRDDERQERRVPSGAGAAGGRCGRQVAAEAALSGRPAAPAPAAPRFSRHAAGTEAVPEAGTSRQQTTREALVTGCSFPPLPNPRRSLWDQPCPAGSGMLLPLRQCWHVRHGLKAGSKEEGLLQFPAALYLSLKIPSSEIQSAFPTASRVRSAVPGSGGSLLRCSVAPLQRRLLALGYHASVRTQPFPAQTLNNSAGHPG